MADYSNTLRPHIWRAEPFELSPSERAEIEATIESLIGVLDAADGDPDAEAFCEDDFLFAKGHGPGCPISDPGGCNIDDRGEDDAGDYDAPGYIAGGGSDGDIVGRGGSQWTA